MCTNEVIGIDFGSFSTSVGVFVDGEVKIIKNELGNSVTSSIISFYDNEVFIGDYAKIQMISNPNNTLFYINNFLNNSNIIDDMINYPFTIINNNGFVNFEITTKNSKKQFSLDDIISIILEKMKRMAVNFLGKDIKKAIITVPAFFNKSQYDIIKKASFKAGFLTIKILKEPIAAALAYGLYKKDEKSQKVLVFHLGGYTQEVSLLSINTSNEGPIMKILISESTNDVCGEKFNDRIIDYLLNCYQKRTGKDASNDIRAVTKLKLEVEEAKKKFLLVPKIRISIEDFYDGQFFSEKITKEIFEQLNDDLFMKSLISIKKVLNQSNTPKNEVDKIILVGGSTKITKIQKKISDFFGDEKKIYSYMDPEEVIARGSAIEGASISNDKNSHMFIEIIPYSFGIKTKNGEETLFIYEKSYFPIKIEKSFVLSSDEQKHFCFDVLLFQNDLLPNYISLNKVNISDLQIDQNGKIQINIIFELLRNSTLIVTVQNENQTNKIFIDIDEKTLKLKFLDQFNYKISKKVNKINNIYKTTINEIRKLEKNYMDGINWFAIDNDQNNDLIIKENMNKLEEIVIKHFKEMFPDKYEQLKNCECRWNWMNDESLDEIFVKPTLPIFIHFLS